MEITKPFLGLRFSIRSWEQTCTHRLQFSSEMELTSIPELKQTHRFLERRGRPEMGREHAKGHTQFTPHPPTIQVSLYKIQGSALLPKISVCSLPLFVISSPSALSQEPLTRASFVQRIADPGSGETVIQHCFMSGTIPRGHTHSCRFKLWGGGGTVGGTTTG